MVEGPGCTNSGNRSRTLVNHRVIGLSGVSSQDSSIATAARGRILVDVLTLGKELFLFFKTDSSSSSEYAIRLHFGMNGSIHITGQEPYSLKKRKLTICLHFSNGGGRFRSFNSTCTSVDAEVARDKVAANQSRDVCSPESIYDENKSFQVLRAATPEIDIATAILDQDISPGTGNIIKNEALHRAGVLPTSTVSSINDVTLMKVVRHCRLYSIAWQRSGRAPAKLVYDRTQCGSCGGVVKMTRVGPGGGRPTFSCLECVGNGGTNKNVTKKRKRPTEKSPTEPPQPGSCCNHPKASKLARVKKTGANQYRLFFTCRARDCNHFVWADATFGKCECDKIAGLRICKKDGRNTGRWFFTCRERECNHFGWASKETIVKLGSLLSPLT